VNILQHGEKMKIQKRLVVGNLRELYQQFKASNPGKESWIFKIAPIAFENLECRALIKVHYLLSNLYWFQDNPRSMSDGE